MDDYTKLLPYIISELKDFRVFKKYLGEDIDPSKASFNFYRSKITSWEEVGNVKHIGGDLNLYASSIITLGNLESVGGSIFLRDSQISFLGKLKHVGGGLHISDTPIKSLGDLETIGGNLSLHETFYLTDLGNLKEVKGEIYYDKRTNTEKLLKERNLI